MDLHHTPILRRVGAVLLAAALIAPTVLANRMTDPWSYLPGISLLAAAAGVFLLRGSLRAASAVRWCAVFALAGSLTLLLSLPLMQPFSLTFTQLRLNQGPPAWVLACSALTVALLTWTTWELGREPVGTARRRANQKHRDMRIPALAGIALVLALGIVLALMRTGEAAGRAKAIAQQQVGADYRLHLRSLHVARGDRGTSVSGVVIAWTDTEIRRIPVHWEGP